MLDAFASATWPLIAPEPSGACPMAGQEFLHKRTEGGGLLQVRSDLNAFADG